jgi:hypothetical protein
MNIQHTRLVQFEEEFGNVDLSRFYQLPTSIKIDKEIKENSMYLTIRYKNTPYCPCFQLPTDIVSYIRKYLTHRIEIKTKIVYSSNYPFVPPIWFIQSVKHTFQIDLLDYYIDKVHQHNTTYLTYMMNPFDVNSLSLLGDWSPAISVEKDILYFLQKINHFDEVLVCAG